MKYRRRFTALVLSLLLAAAAAGQAEEPVVFSGRTDAYDEGIVCMELGDYAEAAEAFAQAGDYQDSADRMNYCKGKAYLRKADDYEAIGYLDPEAVTLVQAAGECFRRCGFEDFEALCLYCEAREYELMGLYPVAVRKYAELKGSYDAADRYTRLNRGEYLKNVSHEPVENVLGEPAEEVPEVIFVQAQAFKDTPVYAGPGLDYLKEETIPVRADTAIVIVGQENRWYLLETETEDGKVRVWAQGYRIERLDSMEPVTYAQQDETFTVPAETEMRYGPGEEYRSRGILLAAGETVTVWHRENGYLLVGKEAGDGQPPVRGWIPAE